MINASSARVSIRYWLAALSWVSLVNWLAILVWIPLYEWLAKKGISSHYGVGFQILYGSQRSHGFHLFPGSHADFGFQSIRGSTFYASAKTVSGFVFSTRCRMSIKTLAVFFNRPTCPSSSLTFAIAPLNASFVF